MLEVDQESLRRFLHEMDEYECENLVADLWAQRGWQTQVTSESRDHGIDIVARKSSPISQKQLIQVKRYGSGNKIGRADIQQYGSLHRQESNVDAVIVVTTSSFTEPARSTARKLNVKLVDGADLTEQILDTWGEWVTDYILIPPESEESIGSGTDTDTDSADSAGRTWSTTDQEETASNRTPADTDRTDEYYEDEPYVSGVESDGTTVEDHSVSEYSESRSSGSDSVSAWQQGRETTSTVSVPQDYLQRWRKGRQFVSVFVFVVSFSGSMWLFGSILNVGTVVSVLLSLGVGVLGFGLFAYVSYKVIRSIYFTIHTG